MRKWKIISQEFEVNIKENKVFIDEEGKKILYPPIFSFRINDYKENKFLIATLSHKEVEKLIDLLTKSLALYQQKSCSNEGEFALLDLEK